MRINFQENDHRPPPRPIVETCKKKSRESFAAIIRPDSEQIEFVTMSQSVTLKENSLRLSKHATAKYVPHAAEVDDYQFYAYVDELANEKRSKPNQFGKMVAQALGFNVMGDIHGPIIFIGPPTLESAVCGQPFDEKTRMHLEKKVNSLMKQK